MPRVATPPLNHVCSNLPTRHHANDELVASKALALESIRFAPSTTVGPIYLLAPSFSIALFSFLAIPNRTVALFHHHQYLSRHSHRFFLSLHTEHRFPETATRQQWRRLRSHRCPSMQHRGSLASTRTTAARPGTSATRSGAQAMMA